MAQAARNIAAALLWLFATAASAGEVESANTVRVLPDEPYGGIVVNQTITVIGRDFYKYFADAWREMPMTERYAISIHEWPSARWGSRIWVQYAQRPVFQVFLPPARANIKPVAEEAVEIAYRNTIDTDVQRLLFRDPDLGLDEM